MMYPWPLAECHHTLNEALEIAMDYLELTRQASPYSETQVWAADAILAAWRSGVRHKIRLANYAIGNPASVPTPSGRDAPGAKDGPPLSEFFLAGLETKSGFSDFHVAIAEVAAGAPFGPRR
jgi:hypothetical protein